MGLQHKLSLGWISKLLYAVLVIVLGWGSAGCAAQAVMWASEAPSAAQPAEGQAPASSEIATEPAPATSADETVLLPAADTIENVVSGLDQVAGSTFDQIPPPTSRLHALSEVFNAFRSEAVNPEADFSPESFKQRHATTYTLPGQGAIFQLVSLSVETNDIGTLDDLLQKTSDWQGQALAIGGLLVYQEFTTDIGVLPPGTYAVLLHREGDTLFFELRGDHDADKGEWVLRRVPEPVPVPPAPYTFVTKKQMCFALRSMQACLNLHAPETEELPAIAKSAVKRLMDAKLLPQDVNVNIEGALASATGLDVVEECQAVLEENPKACQPSYVTAAVVPHVEGEQPLAFSSGVAVMEVSRPIAGPIVDASGNETRLDIGTYRLDVVRLDDHTLAGQLVSADQKSYYIPLTIAVAEGEIVHPDTLMGLESDAVQESYVILDATIWSWCSDSGEDRSPPECDNPQIRRKLCWDECS
jgi:hypothetical protein